MVSVVVYNSQFICANQSHNLSSVTICSLSAPSTYILLNIIRIYMYVEDTPIFLLPFNVFGGFYNCVSACVFVVCFAAIQFGFKEFQSIKTNQNCTVLCLGIYGIHTYIYIYLPKYLSLINCAAEQ